MSSTVKVKEKQEQRKINVQHNRVYSVKHKDIEMKCLIVYNISGNHYIGLRVYDEKTTGGFYINDIDKYVVYSEIYDIAHKEIKHPIYVKGRVLSITPKTYKHICHNIKDFFITQLDKMTVATIPNDLSYLKWFCKTLTLQKEDNKEEVYKQGEICWVDFGANIGSELRKLRPAILWRSTRDKKMWTMIPLSTKANQDDYYFHYDMTSVHDCSAKIESLMNFSSKRIIDHYYSNNCRTFLNRENYEKIKDIMRRYYYLNCDETLAISITGVDNE